jgi:hypothetical protein
VTNKIFLSYGREELGFVDDLVGRLETEGYDVWLEYRDLIPGQSWTEQLEKGKNESDTILLVVSKKSVNSQWVQKEWQHFLDSNKRVILLIFDAEDIDEKLEQYEWVDFRGNYKTGLRELFRQLKQPEKEEHPVPESGFKAPAIVWFALGLSIVVALLSFSVIWTVLIPWILVPLPFKILKRSYNFTQTQTTLIALPIAAILSFSVYDDPFLDITAVGGFVAGLVLLFTLRSAGMQRWGKLEAIIPKYINPKKIGELKPAPVTFYIDYAVQDSFAANELKEVLKKYGHIQAENIQDAEVVFVFTSQFKSDSDVDPEKQTVYPINIQTNKPTEKLGQNQWIDFRPGVRGLDVIAKLLDKPKELVNALGMRPVSDQTVYPPVITTLYYYFITLAVISIGSSLDYIFASPALFDVSEETAGSVFIGFIASLLLFIGLTFFMLRGMTRRKGLFARFGWIIIGIIAIGFLLLWHSNLEYLIFEELDYFGLDEPSSFLWVTYVVYFLGIFVLGFILFRNRLDVKRWFPAKK